MKLPKEVFELLPDLYPRLVQVFLERRLKPPEFFALSYTKHFGRMNSDHEQVLQARELRKILKHALGHSAAGVTAFIQGLVNRGFLEMKALTDNERNQLFPEGSTFHSVVILTATGAKELEKMNEALDGLFQSVTADVPTRLVNGSLTLLKIYLKKRKKKSFDSRVATARE